MALTEEQRKRIEDNRKRALEIKRKRKIEKEKNEKDAVTDAGNVPCVFEAGGFAGSEEKVETQNKKRREERLTDVATGKNEARGNSNARHILNGSTTRTNEDSIGNDDESSLEDFEIDAAPHISQTEAQRTYCVPLGTLAVCSFIEKDNPHKRGWSKMKLYDRAEVRRRARKRFGGKGRLVEERERRKKKRFEKDLQEMKDVFH